MSEAANQKEPFYRPGKGLRAAVEVARDLNMPLLVTGEPGTGKTTLAQWIAGSNMLNSTVFRFNTKTTSTAKDLFYRYDAIRHFGQKKSNPLQFVSFEAFGKAILYSRPDFRPVVLIDEIDKAPRDFPNDLLYEFEAYSFRVEEASIKDIEDFDFSKIGANIEIQDDGYIRSNCPTPPFLLLTSNSEKNLPDAFLRRCVFYHIEFPEKELLLEIVRKKTPIGERYEKHIDTIIEFFLSIRDNGGLRKPPATAELMNWVKSIIGRDIDWEALKEPGMRDKLIATLPVLAKNTGDMEAAKARVDHIIAAAS